MFQIIQDQTICGKSTFLYLKLFSEFTITIKTIYVRNEHPHKIYEAMLSKFGKQII